MELRELPIYELTNPDTDECRLIQLTEFQAVLLAKILAELGTVIEVTRWTEQK